MRPGDRAWVALGGGILAYDLLCAPGQTLSEAADSYMEHHPWLTRAVAGVIVLHVCNGLPQQLDIVHWLFQAKRLLR